MPFGIKIAILSVAIFYVVIIIEVTNMFEKFAEDVVRRYQEKLATLGSSLRQISFPKSEVPELKNRDKIITHRVSNEQGKYSKNEIVKAPWGSNYKIDNIMTVSSVDNSPYYNNLTKQQKNTLNKYDKIDVITLNRCKTAALETLQHFTKSGPKDKISKSVSQWHTENQSEAEAFLFDLYNKLGWKHNNPAKYMKTRHEIEDWMYNQLPHLNVQAKTKFPIYSAMDLGYIPEVFKDMKSHLEIPVKGLENRLTFTMGDSIPVLSRVPVEDRKLYNLSDIHNMGLDEVIKRVKASTSNSRGQDYLEAQLWITPEEAQQMAKFINNR